MYHYTVEMYDSKTKQWSTENRYYRIEKNLSDFDLHDHLTTCGQGNLRKNARFITKIN